MIKTALFIISSAMTVLMASCSRKFYGGIHEPPAPPHGGRGADLNFIFGPGAGSDRILNVAIKILIIVALVLLIKILYDKHNKKK